MTMTRATAFLTLVLLAGLSAGCSIGMTAKKYRPAQAPKGVIVHVDSTQGKFSGELIEVRDSGIVLLADQKLRLLRYTEILSSSIDQTSSRYAPSNRTAPKPDVQAHLRLLSRFPQGLTPELMGQLLNAYGQTGLATRSRVINRHLGKWPTLGRSDRGNLSDHSRYAVHEKRRAGLPHAGVWAARRARRRRWRRRLRLLGAHRSSCRSRGGSSSRSQNPAVHRSAMSSGLLTAPTLIPMDSKSPLPWHRMACERTRILLLGVRQVRDQPPPTRIRLDFRRRRAGVHDKTIEFHHPSYRVVRQQLSPREFRIEMLHLQKLPDLLCFVAERALGDAGELAKLIARHEDVLGLIEQEINAADDVERRSGPDPQVPAR